MSELDADIGDYGIGNYGMLLVLDASQGAVKTEANAKLLGALKIDIGDVQGEEARLLALISERDALLARVHRLLGGVGADGSAVKAEMGAKTDSLTAEITKFKLAKEAVEASTKVGIFSQC